MRPGPTVPPEKSLYDALHQDLVCQGFTPGSNRLSGLHRVTYTHPSRWTDRQEARIMASPSLDTFSAARALEAAGVERSQAETIASAIAHTDELATKQDVRALKSDFSGLQSEFSDLRSEFSDLKSDFSGLQSEFSDLRSEFSDLKSDFSGLQSEFSDLKSDFSDLKSDFSGLRLEFSGLRSEFKTDLANLETRMYRALWIQGGAIVAIVTALKLLE